MIPVAEVRKPNDYDSTKQLGDAWLRANPGARRPKPLWLPFLKHLEEGFSSLCGYAAMLDPTGGTVDHYLSWSKRPDLAYEWTNFRFVSATINASKRTADDAVLDPYVVMSGWFEILLPSLQMCVTDKVPAEQRAIAEFTLKRLKLRDGERIIRWRRHWYEKYQEGKLDLDGLRDWAPLIADAVVREQRSAAAKNPRGSQRKKRNP